MNISRLIRSALLLALFIASGKVAAAPDNGTIVLDPQDEEIVHSVLVSGDFIDITINGDSTGFSGDWESDPISSDTLSSEAGRSARSGMESIVSDGRLILRSRGDKSRYQITLNVPTEWSVRAQVYRQGFIKIKGLDGAVSAWSARGDVELLDQTGPFSATAMDGRAIVVFDGKELVAPCAITGNVPNRNDVAVNLFIEPALSASFRVVSAGDLTWGGLAVKETSTQRDSFEFNGGGEEITLRSVNGSIAVSGNESAGEG